MSNDLWPEFESPPSEQTPRAILLQQSAHLRKRTRGLIEAEVLSGLTKLMPEEFKAMFEANFPDGLTSGIFLHRLEIVVPHLNHYRTKLLGVYQAVESFYPVGISAVGVRSYALTDDEFIEKLREALGGDRIRILLRNLLANVKT